MQQRESGKKMSQHNFTPPHTRVAAKSPQRVCNRYTPPKKDKKGICTLPKNFYQISPFKQIFNDIINGKFTVAAWLKQKQNRLALANLLSGEMNVNILKDLCTGDKEVRGRWAQKLNRQLRQYKEQHDIQAKRRHKSNLRGALGSSLPMRQAFLDYASIRQLVSELHALESHQVLPSSIAGRYKRIAWALTEAIKPRLQVETAPQPQDSLVWVLKGHIFDSFVINEVSTIIRSLGKGEICWSNFSLGDNPDNSTYAQLDIRADEKSLLTKARIQLLKLFQRTKNLQYGPPGSPGLVAPQRNTRCDVESKTENTALYKLVGHLLDRQIINDVVHVLKSCSECTARIKSLEIRGEKDTAIIELEGDPFVCDTMVKRCVEVLRDCDAKYDTGPAQQALFLKLSEEDVDRTMRSWTMEKFEQEPCFIPTLSVSPLSLNSGSCGASVVDSVTSFPFSNPVDNSIIRSSSNSSPESNSPPHSPRHSVCRRLGFLKEHSRHRSESPLSLDLQDPHPPRRLHPCSRSPLKSRPRYNSPPPSSFSSTRIASFRERGTTTPPSPCLRVQSLVLSSVNETPADDDNKSDMRRSGNDQNNRFA